MNHRKKANENGTPKILLEIFGEDSPGWNHPKELF
jgi:hypothetical protein